MTTQTPRSATRQAVASLTYNASSIIGIAAGGTAAWATHRLLPAVWTSGARTLTAGTAGLAVTVLVDDITDTALAPLRARLRPHPAQPEKRILTPLTTLEDALAHATADTCDDAARRAATMAGTLDMGDGLLRDERRWQGHIDGTAHLAIAPGTVVFYTPHRSTYAPRHEYTLLTSETDAPLVIEDLAQLRLHLEARAAGLPVARDLEDAGAAAARAVVPRHGAA